MNTATAPAPDVLAIEAVPFSVEDHLHGTVELLMRLRATDAVYPPADAGHTPEGLTLWLLDGIGAGHWVTVVDGAVTGHIGLTAPGPQMITALADLGHVSPASAGVLEIGRFFTDPAYRRTGLGAELFRTACRTAEETGHQPALSVLAGSAGARSFCAGHGLQELGSVIGSQGRSIVFARDRAATRADRFEAMRVGLLNLLS
ncbi:MAG TPA: GNAT family N-acetyltransferase [Arthrobacter sp.]